MGTSSAVGGGDGGVILLEMRHRFANSLELIASLIRLHLRDVESEEARLRLQSVLDAVKVAGHLQAQVDAPSELTFAAILKALAASWSSIGERRGVDVRLSIDAAATVPRQLCTSLALIAQELVTNSLIHGFGDGRAGTIEIALAPIPDGHKMLQVKDDGAGFDEHLAPKDRPSIGLELVRTLSAQVGGTFTIEHVVSGGTDARIVFPG